MKKLVLLFLFVSIGFWLFGYSVFVWDDDGGSTFIDQETQQLIGCEDGIVSSLDSLQVESVISEILPPAAELANYDAVFVTTGWRSASDLLTPEEKDILSEYIQVYHGRLYMEGTNLVEFMATDTLFMEQFAIKLIGAGSNVSPNLDSLIGNPNTLFSGLRLAYYSEASGPNLGVDSVLADTSQPGEATDFLLDAFEGKFIYSRGSAYSEYDETKADAYVNYKTVVQSPLISAMYPTEDRIQYVDKVTQFFGRIRVLIVNDSSYPDSSLMAVYTDIMDSLGYEWDTVTVPLQSPGPSFEDMKDFTAVIWFTADQTDNTLLSTDQTNIAQFLDNTGGYFVLVGPAVGRDIGVIGVAPDNYSENQLLVLYFGTDFIASGAPVDGVYGNPSNVLPTFNALYNAYGIEDEIATINGGQELLYSVNDDHCVAITYVPFYAPFKTAYFSIGIENLFSSAKANSAQITALKNVFTQTFKLPNLFVEGGLYHPVIEKYEKENIKDNVNTILKVFYEKSFLTINVANDVTVSIYDKSGRKIERLTLKKGSNKVRVSLKEGVYYLNDGYNGVKFVVVK